MGTRTRRIFFGIFIAFLLLFYVCRRQTSYGNLENKTAVSMKSLLIGAIRTAELGGLEVVAIHEQANLNVETKGKTKEGANDPVTAADYRSHCVMYHSLTEAFPGINVISEEISKDCDKVTIFDLKHVNKEDKYDVGKDALVNANDVTIWIDPLDATKEFTENLLQYVTTMVCVAIKGEPVIGVIYKPFEKKTTSNLFWTWADHGVSENLKNLPQFSKQPEVNGTPTLIVSRSHAGHVNNASKIAFGSTIKVISAAGAGYKFLELAFNRADAYVHMTAIKKWDICAGAAILSALGGTVTSLFHQEPILFGPDGSKILNSGLLATMKGHKWFLDKFSHLEE